MPRNRVHELEETVEQLQGTVDGLMVELVEVNKRLRELEGEHEADEPAESEPTTVDSSAESDGSDIIIC